MNKIDPNARKGIVWIASYPKSGNTWMRIFLYHLVRIVGGHEGDVDSLDDLQRIGGAEAGRIDLFERFMGRPVVGAPFREIAAVRPRVQAAIAAEANGIAFIKTHTALGMAAGSPTIDFSSTAGAVYVMRNPLDIAASLSAHFGLSLDEAIDRMCMENCTFSPRDTLAPEFWGSWSQNVASWTSQRNPTILPVRYEDMLSMPKAVFRTVANFVGQPATDKQLATAMRLSSFKRLKDIESERGFAEAVREGQPFFREGRAGGWRGILSQMQISRIVTAHNDQMRRVGYLTDDLMHLIP
jgi:hypothetical protein